MADEKDKVDFLMEPSGLSDEELEDVAGGAPVECQTGWVCDRGNSETKELDQV